MATPITSAQAVKKWLQHESLPLTAKEMMEFWRVCSAEEKAEYARVSVEELNNYRVDGHPFALKSTTA